MEDSILLQLNSQGLIPGPEESEEDFLKRADFCLHLNDHLAEKAGLEVPFTEEEEDNQPLKEAMPKVEKLYGIAPEWLPLYFSNYRLLPWHGGCAWIFQLREELPTAAFLQLSKRLHSKRSLFGLYKRDEVIAHESAHVGRMLFDEPRFEEFFAYRASASSFQRFFGPLIQSSKESVLFLFLLLLLVMFDLFILLMGPMEALGFVQWFKLLPLGLIALASLRLTLRHRQLLLCRGKFLHIKDPDHFLYRLTDREIISFARWSPQEIKAYIASCTSLRWRLLRLAYLKKFLQNVPD